MRVLCCLLVVCFTAQSAVARDDTRFFGIQSAMNLGEKKTPIADKHIKFYFGDQPHAEVVERFVKVDALRKTNSFGKSPQDACEWAFLSALLVLREKAIDYGANAVVNIHSYYDKKPFESNEKFECHDGAITTGVALRGSIVTLEE
ncbi:hypothetical protein NBRC116495_31390 [Aurantivibrio plasticivorans]